MTLWRAIDALKHWPLALIFFVLAWCFWWVRWEK